MKRKVQDDMQLTLPLFDTPETTAPVTGKTPSEKSSDKHKTPVVTKAVTVMKPKVVKKSTTPEGHDPRKDDGVLALRATLKGKVDNKDLRGILGEAGITSLSFNNRWSTWGVISQSVIMSFSLTGSRRADMDISATNHDDGSNEFVLYFIYLTKEAATVVTPVKILLRNSDTSGSRMEVEKMTLLDSVVPKKVYCNNIFVQDAATLEARIREKKPYVWSWLTEKKYDINSYIVAPWLETLEKAGYKFAEYILRNRISSLATSSIDCLNRLTTAGSKPKDILKTTKAVYLTLKEEQRLKTWDAFRRIANGPSITDDSIRMAYERNWNERNLEMVASVLAARYEGKPVFSWTSLVNYLGRLDMYEALCDSEALPILRDYLHMCSTLNMEPRIDGDSLKREHDIAARMVRERRDELRKKKLDNYVLNQDRKISEGKDTKLARLDYSEGLYTIRRIRGYDDLQDEALQQHNCVAGYADRIAEGRSHILVMRETAHPDKSLITVELSPDFRQIRQKYLAYNQPVRSRSQSEFLERWMRQLNAA